MDILQNEFNRGRGYVDRRNPSKYNEYSYPKMEASEEKTID